MSNKRPIYSLTIEPSSGAQIGDVAESAYGLGRELGIKTMFTFNGKKYKPVLNIEETTEK